MDDDIAQMIDELSASNKGTIFADFEYDREGEQPPAASAAAPKVEGRPELKKAFSRRRLGLKKTFSRRLTQTQLKQYGIEDDDDDANDTESLDESIAAPQMEARPGLK